MLCLPLTLLGSHSQYDPSGHMFHQEEKQLVVHRPLFAPTIIQVRDQGQGYIHVSTGHTAVGCQGTGTKRPTLRTIPVRLMPVNGYTSGQLYPPALTTYPQGELAYPQGIPSRLHCPSSQDEGQEASPVLLTW